MPDAATRMVERAALARKAKGLLTEVERIVGLPRRRPPMDLPDREVAAVVAKWTEALRKHPLAPPLRPVQAFALEDASTLSAPKGLFCSVGVGHGKTVLGLLLPDVMRVKRPLLLVPPSMLEQYEQDCKVWMEHYHFRPPTVLPYSRLSMAESTDVLDELQPDLIIADEGTALRHSSSARTKRLMRYMRENPTTRFVTMSGAVTTSSLLDYSNLLELALRDGSPLPQTRNVLDQWCSVVDPAGHPDDASWDSIWPLVRAVGYDGPPDWRTSKDRLLRARAALRVRLEATPGIITTREASSDAELLLVVRRPAVPPEITAALKTLDTTWGTPDGEPLSDAMAVARVASCLSSGFYYRWVWPGGKIDKAWMDARNEWNGAVASVLRYNSRVDLDSPLLVQQSAEDGRGGARVQAAWAIWQPVKGRKAPPVEAVWLSSAIVDDAVTWAGNHAVRGTSTIIWYSSRAMEQALAARGVPVYGEGSSSPVFPTTPGPVACSIAVHGKGKNFQAWTRHLVVEPPAAGDTWEQLLGRSHRQGQTAARVVVGINGHTPRARAALERAVSEALYIEQTQGTAQKLNLAQWSAVEPMPLTEIVDD